jgi:5-methylcytosine-specific restriction endonuclease McrA
MPFDSKDKKRAWRESPEVRERQREHQRKYRDKCKALGITHYKPKPRVRRIGRDPIKVKATQKTHREKTRALALSMLGGKCCRCGFADARALEIDHVRALHRRTTGRTSAKDWLREIEACLKSPTKGHNLQLLCANCHRIKTFENGEHTAWRNRSPESPPPKTADMFDGSLLGAPTRVAMQLDFAPVSAPHGSVTVPVLGARFGQWPAN